MVEWTLNRDASTDVKVRGKTFSSKTPFPILLISCRPPFTPVS